MSVEFLYFYSIQMIRRYLSHHTKDPKYRKVIDAVYKTLKSIPTQDGSSGDISMGAMADSYYEYLLKMWIQSGKKDEVRASRSLYS